jgi:hypothetical protein
LNRFDTVGRPVIDEAGRHVKDYLITDKETKESIYAERQSNGKYNAKIGSTVHGNTSIKQLKQDFAVWLESRDNGLEVEVGQESESVDEGSGLWDCCHPAAIIIELLAVIPAGTLDGPDGRAFKSVIDQTLDNYGYKDEKGHPDYSQARREIDHWVAKAPDNQGKA